MSHAVGVDVSQGTLEACAEPQGASRTFANTAAGIADLLAWLEPMTPTRVVFEASGGYEKALLHAVVAVGWPPAGSMRNGCITSPGRWASVPRPIRWMRRCCSASAT